MSSAIEPFAIDTGLMRPSFTQGSNTTVSLYNTNTQKITQATLPITSDESETVYEGDFAMDGVCAAAKIQLTSLTPVLRIRGNCFQLVTLLISLTEFRSHASMPGIRASL
jgi:2-methylaconitate cis-trans-isomerase PrpF